ncbi:hypothetical protein ACH36K_11305 [Clostridium sp. MB05]|jgi:TusA-related sulfurtransferase|uniref:hypothetical protein n=1 Tax=Clostridium sp. MB05 TaxID=3376682 RepID=UPI003981D73A
MEIQKGKIIEVWNDNHNKVLKYRQVIRNNTLNEVAEIETKSLNSLMSKVRQQLNEWDKIT